MSSGRRPERALIRAAVPTIGALVSVARDQRGSCGRAPALLRADGSAPIMAVQTGGTVSPEQSFMGAAVNGWGGWFSASPVPERPIK